MREEAARTVRRRRRPGRRQGGAYREEESGQKSRNERAHPGRTASVEMGLWVFYETCPFFFFKVLLDIFMFICLNLGPASWKMHEE